MIRWKTSQPVERKEVSEKCSVFKGGNLHTVNIIVLMIFSFASFTGNLLPDNKHAIHKWSKQGKLKKLVLIINKNPQLVDSKDKYGWTPLQIAAARGHIDIVKYLVEKGADVNIVDTYGFSALHLAALKGDNRVFEWLVDHGAVLKSDTRSQKVFSQIFEAAELRDELVELLFNNPQNRDQILDNLSQKEVKGPGLLIKMGFKEQWMDVQLQREPGQGKSKGQLKIAPDALRRLRQLADNFVARRIDAHNSKKIGSTMLHDAAQTGDLERVKGLLKTRRQLVNQPNRLGITALHYASAAGFREIVRLLLDAGARVDIKTRSGITPLYGAVSEAREEVIRLLIARGADVGATTADGATALHIATTGAVARLLVAGGAKVRAANKFNFTPLHVAAHYGHIEVAEYLLTVGAKLEARTNTGWTPLCEAVFGQKLAMVKFLAGKGADVNAKTRSGTTPMDLAAGFKNFPMMDVLKQHGALPVVIPSNGRQSK